MPLVVEELPSWISDSQFQRVEWLNAVLQKVWPQISLGCEDIVKAAVQPVLDAQCPAVLGSMRLARFSLGTISPKVVGVRLYENSESLVRLDVELRWAGDPSIVLSVGSRVPTPIEVSELRFSAVARVELLGLRPRMPCFTAASVTFMKRPFVDFSLKVARLDVMNIGPADYNVTAIVRNIIHNALSEAALYPKKVVIPLVDDGESTSDLAVMNPVGILYVTFVKGNNLMKANIFGSDPYVLAKSLHQEVRTAVKYYSLNPHWGESYDFVVYDKASQEVELQVKIIAFC
jgi:Ca2+-dependent lipid-binding protein